MSLLVNPADFMDLYTVERLGIGLIVLAKQRRMVEAVVQGWSRMYFEISAQNGDGFLATGFLLRRFCNLEPIRCTQPWMVDLGVFVIVDALRKLFSKKYALTPALTCSTL